MQGLNRCRWCLQQGLCSVDSRAVWPLYTTSHMLCTFMGDPLSLMQVRTAVGGHPPKYVGWATYR